MMNRQILGASCLALLFISCSTFQKPQETFHRGLQSLQNDLTEFQNDPVQWVEEMKGLPLESFCQNEVVAKTQVLESLDFETLQHEKIRIVGLDWLKKSFDLKVHFNRNLSGLSEDCRMKMIPFFRALRQLEDYVGEIAYAEKPKNAFEIDFSKVAPPILEPKAYSPFQLAKDYESPLGFQFEAGDIALTRGISFVSATISQSTVDQSHFSHGVFLHKTPQGEMKTIESYLQQGVAYYSLREAMKNENARILVFRNRNQELAKRASEKMGRTLDERKSIPYDYAMDYQDHSRMTCAEVIVSAYEWASENQFRIPFSKTDLRYKNPYVLKKLNMEGTPTFSPIAMEVDPRFDLVLEWRDYSLVRDQRQKDMILRKIFDWMEKDQYILHENLSTLALRTVWATRKFPLLWNLVSKPFDLDKVPKDTPKSFLLSIAQLRNVGEILLKEVKRADLEYEKKNGFPMSEKRLLEFLEKFRLEDAERFQYGGRTVFHHQFRPWGLVRQENDK